MNNIELTNYIQDLLPEEFTEFLSAPSEPTAIRVNSLKMDSETFYERLCEKGVKPVPLFMNKNGFAVEERSLAMSHTLDFFQGHFFYQGISSQIPALILDPGPGDRVLDLAAAPGSKSSQIGALMRNRGMLVANDVSRSRIQALNVNTQRAGMINHLIYNLAGERFGNMFPGFFDKVLIDAPCTALGTLSTNKEIWSWWSLEKLNKLAGRQETLLIAGIKALRAGGELVYSTCSLTPEENECHIERMLKSYPLEIVSMQKNWFEVYDHGILCSPTSKPGEIASNSLRIYPHRHNQEGFFVIKIRKTDHITRPATEKKYNMMEPKKPDHPDILPVLKDVSKNWGIPSETWKQYRYLRTKERLWMLNDEMTAFPDERFMNGGLLLAEKRGHMWKLTNQSVQFFSGHISKRLLELSREELAHIFLHGRCQKTGLMDGYYALQFNHNVIASIYVNDSTCTLRLPHFFRLVL